MVCRGSVTFVLLLVIESGPLSSICSAHVARDGKFSVSEDELSLLQVTPARVTRNSPAKPWKRPTLLEATGRSTESLLQPRAPVLLQQLWNSSAASLVSESLANARARLQTFSNSAAASLVTEGGILAKGRSQYQESVVFAPWVGTVFVFALVGLIILAGVVTLFVWATKKEQQPSDGPPRPFDMKVGLFGVDAPQPSPAEERTAGDAPKLHMLGVGPYASLTHMEQRFFISMDALLGGEGENSMDVLGISGRNLLHAEVSGGAGGRRSLFVHSVPLLAGEPPRCAIHAPPLARFGGTLAQGPLEVCGPAWQTFGTLEPVATEDAEGNVTVTSLLFVAKVPVIKFEILAPRGSTRDLRMRASMTEEGGGAGGSRTYADAMMAVAEPLVEYSHDHTDVIKAARRHGLRPRQLLQVRVMPNSDAVLIMSCMLAMQLLWPKNGKPGSLHAPISGPSLRLRSPSPLCTAAPAQPAGNAINEAAEVWQGTASGPASIPAAEARSPSTSEPATPKIGPPVVAG